MSDIGSRIRDLRKARGWTQEQLGERCKRSWNTIHRIETGQVSPRLDDMEAISEALETNFQVILGAPGPAGDLEARLPRSDPDRSASPPP